MQHQDSWIPASRRFPGRVLFGVVFAVAAGWCHSGRSQWITQTNALKAGWNSVYLHVDASHTNVNSLIGPLDPIEEIWLWTYDLPPGLSLATPPVPTTGSRWSKWTKIEGVNSGLQTLRGNSAMLVKVSSGVAAFNWRVKGQPVPPNHRWSLSGLNFVGFPSAGTNFEAFLAPDAQAVDWKLNAEIFRYVGGNFGTTNPIPLTFLLRHPTLGMVNREQAYWIRAGDLTNQIYNHYFGPFEVTGADTAGLRFGDSQGQARLRLKNMTRGNLTVTVRELQSEASPGGVTPPLLPLMVRGSINTSNLTFSYSNLAAGPSQWTLAPNGSPGSEVEIVLGVDRSQMGTSAGAPFAGVLRFTDSLGLMRTDIGVSGTTPSSTGLWVGNATVTNVSQYLKPYVTATNVGAFHEKLNALTLTVGSSTQSVAFGPDGHRYEWDTNTGRILVFGSATNQPNSPINYGSYLVPDGATHLVPDGVARPFPLRLIIHNNGSTAKLLQRAYLGRDGCSNLVVATRESLLLATDLANARRLSAVHLPTSDANEGWAFNNAMRAGATMATTVDLLFYDHASNPFLHTYHPDHDNRDNRDDTFQTEFTVGGKESYDIRREIRLTFGTPGVDFDSRTRGTSMTGTYAESVSFRADTKVLKQFEVLGGFTLTRIIDIATLATTACP